MIRFLNAHFATRTLFLGISEACLVVLTFVVVTIARLGVGDGTLVLSYEQGFLKILVVAAIFIMSMYYFDLYDSSILRNRREVLTRMIQVLGTACILLGILYYLYPSLAPGRGIFLAGFVLVAIFLMLGRRVFFSINSLPKFAEQVLIFGEGPLAEPLSTELRLRSELGLRVVGHIPEGTKGSGESAGSNGVDRAIDLGEYVAFHQVNRIIVAMGDRRGKLPVEQLLSLKARGVVIQDAAEVYEAITGKLPLESLHLGSLLFSSGFHVARGLRIYKRLVSLFVSLIVLLLCLPLVPLIALAIKLSSPGPILYRQERVGLNGRVFNCYKFRTMRPDAEADTGPTWASDNDPRITAVGRFLRLSRFDEIPQFWNVLRADMSLIGPRPERPEFVDWLNREIPHYFLRHTIRPGITGWAQIRYRYGSSVEDAKEKLRYDLFYIKNMSPGLDLLILVDTIKTILLGRGAQ